MAIDIVEITSYKVSLLSSNEDDKALIFCKGLGDQEILLHFQGTTAPFPTVPVKTGGSSGELGKFLYILYFRYSDMANVVDMLRNEKPIYMKYNPDNTPTQARISSDSGPLI